MVSPVESRNAELQITWPPWWKLAWQDILIGHLQEKRQKGETHAYPHVSELNDWMLCEVSSSSCSITIKYAFLSSEAELELNHLCKNNWLPGSRVLYATCSSSSSNFPKRKMLTALFFLKSLTNVLFSPFFGGVKRGLCYSLYHGEN